MNKPKLLVIDDVVQILDSTWAYQQHYLVIPDSLDNPTCWNFALHTPHVTEGVIFLAEIAAKNGNNVKFHSHTTIANQIVRSTKIWLLSSKGGPDRTPSMCDTLYDALEETSVEAVAQLKTLFNNKKIQYTVNNDTHN